MLFNVNKIREDFFTTSSQFSGQPPIYLDSACTTLRPNSVIDAGNLYYLNHPSCHGRAVHQFGQETTKVFEGARARIKNFLNAQKSDEIIFAKNTTEALNIIAQGFSFKEGDVILTTNLEHNSNLLPWQMLCNQKGIVYKRCTISPTDDEFSLALYEEMFLKNKIKLVSMFHISNVTGMILPIREMVKIAHEHGALFMLDAAQSVVSQNIDVRELDVDFLTFSFHKAFGPSAFGVLYGKYELLKNIKPLCCGGESVVDAQYDSLVWANVPHRFEAGLQNYAAAAAATAALDFIEKIGPHKILAHEISLNQFATEQLLLNDQIKILGPSQANQRSAILNFNILDKNMGEVSRLLDQSKSIMCRSGVHCCHAWYHFNKLPPSLRVSFSVYNTQKEIEIFIEAIQLIIRYF